MHKAITIDVVPQPWGTKWVRIGQHQRLAKTAKFREYQEAIYFALREATGWREHTAILRMDLVAVFPRPKRLLRKKDADGLLYHCKDPYAREHGLTPDRDNVAKGVQDAMHKGCPKGYTPLLADDSQVVVGEELKLYAERGGRPRIVVVLNDELPEDPAELLHAMGLIHLFR